MPTLKLAGRTGTPARKAPARTAPKRKPAATKAPARKPAASTRKPAAVEAVEATPRGPKIPEGWTKAEFTRAIKDMQKAREARDNAEARMAEARRAANAMAINLLNEGVQMSLISTELDLSRQWMYTLLDKLAEGKIDEDANPIENPKPRAKRAAKAKPAATKPAAKRRPGTKPAAKTAPARKRPAAPAGRGRIRIAA